MAKVGDRIAKVVCKRCGAQHNYRSDAPREDRAETNERWRAETSKSRKRNVEPKPDPIPPFDASKPPRPYAGSGSYAPGERVAHPSFGTGVVTGSPGPGKVAIAFPSGPRVLACAKAVSTLERPVAMTERPPRAG